MDALQKPSSSPKNSRNETLGGARWGKKEGQPYGLPLMGRTIGYSSKRRRKRSSIRLVNDPPLPLARFCR